MTRLLFFLTLALGQLAMSQSTGSIYGRITDFDEEGEPLLFATIGLKDTPIVEQTNFHGNFEINGVQPGSYILQVNYLGYEPKEIDIEVKADEIVIVEEALRTLTMHTENIRLTQVSNPLTKVSDKAEQR